MKIQLILSLMEAVASGGPTGSTEASTFMTSATSTFTWLGVEHPETGASRFTIFLHKLDAPVVLLEIAWTSTIGRELKVPFPTAIPAQERASALLKPEPDTST